MGKMASEKNSPNEDSKGINDIDIEFLSDSEDEATTTRKLINEEA